MPRGQGLIGVTDDSGRAELFDRRLYAPARVDTSPGLVEGLKRGEIQALVAQNPKKMGREAVQALVAKMKGETVLPVIDSGAAVVTKENLGIPEIQAVLVQSKDIQWSWVSDTVALKELDSCSNLT